MALGVDSLGDKVTGMGMETELSPLEVLLITEPSVQPLHYYYYYYKILKHGLAMYLTDLKPTMQLMMALNS